MQIELELKDLIIKKSSSIRQFASEVNIPVTTIQSMLTSGIENAGVKKVMKICDYLGIETDALADGYIKEKTIAASGITINEFNHIKKYRNLDDYGKKAVDTTLNNEYDRCNNDVHFVNYDDALEFMRRRPMYGAGGVNIEKMDEEKLIKWANDFWLLEQKAKDYLD